MAIFSKWKFIALGALLLAVAAITIGGALALFTDTDPVGTNTFATDTLNPPTSLTATGGTTINLNWTATADTYASGHRVLRATATGGPYTQIAEVTPRTTTTYADSPADGTYYYVVRAFFKNLESANSNEASATKSSATTVSFVSVADTWVREKNPDSNFGPDLVMTVKSRAIRNGRSLVRFDVSSIPAGSTVSSATLTLCIDPLDPPTAAGRTYEVHQVTAAWTEGDGITGVTWNTQPTVAATATASVTMPASGCMSWTVTADVAAWVAGTANNGLRVKDSVESDPAMPSTDLRTRENTLVAERPDLTVTYTAP